MRTELWSGLIVGIGMACGPSAFTCSDDDDCGAQGQCEPQGFCSFPDAACPSGQRFGEHAGDGLAGQCTAPPGTETGSDGGSSPATTSTSTTAPTTPVPDGSSSSPADSSTGPPTQCPPDWWDCAWPYRRMLTVEGDQVSEVLDDLPVLMSVPDHSDRARFGDGTDARIVDGAGAQLSFEIDTWDDTVGLLWVRIPQIEPGVGATAWLYYGNPGAAPGDDGPGTWNEHYVGVWHLDDEQDSTQYANDAIDEGSSAVPGLFGTARAFDGVAGRLLVPGSESIDDLVSDGMTLTAWINPVSTGGTSGGRVADKADIAASNVGWTMMLDTPVVGAMEINRGASTAEGVYVTMPALEFGSWQLIAVRMVDDMPAELLHNGAGVGLGTSSPPVGRLGSDAGVPLGIGGAPYDDLHTYDGTIDELRLSRTLRSDAWVRAELSAGRGELLTVGDEQSLP